LKLENSSKVRQMMYNFDEEIEVGTSSKWITNILSPSDNVIVPTNTGVKT
jgi:hypothetical protein